MNWKVLSTAFAIIFLAELGDKTQLAAMSLAASTRRPWEVFLGGALALAAVTALGVAAGHLAGRWLPEALVRKAAALLFVGAGVWLWARG